MFCAMDFSGNQESGNYKYLAVVACTAEFLNPIISGANLRNTVKSTASKKARRQDILAKLDAEKSGCLALCLKTDKASILSGIVRMAERQKKAPKSESLAYAYDNAVMEGIRVDLDQFLNRHGRSLGDVKIEADHDCKDLLRHANIRQTGESYAHMIADAVAWANNRGDEPRGVKPRDITGHLYKRLKGKFGKRRPRIKHSKG